MLQDIYTQVSVGSSSYSKWLIGVQIIWNDRHAGITFMTLANPLVNTDVYLANACSHKTYFQVHEELIIFTEKFATSSNMLHLL